MLIFILITTNFIYSAGSFKFSIVVLLIAGIELVKISCGDKYIKSSNKPNVSKRYLENSFISLVFNQKKFKDFLRNAVVLFISLSIYFIVAILYGAEVFSKYEETFMFSLILTTLTIYPPCITLSHNSVWALILGSKPHNKLEELHYQNIYLTVLGAWLGAFVIPLDWDRPWQIWPIPCSFGAIIGYTFSHMIMFLKLKCEILKSYKIMRGEGVYYLNAT
mgnify:FL=1